MATISLCMIVKNEEDVLARCLESIAEAVDEIIILDTGSTDQTIPIALSFTPFVFSHPWKDDFAQARNAAFAKATKDYCMWLDADDVVPAASCQALIELKKDLQADIVMLPYETAFDENGKSVFSFFRERLIKRDLHLPWVGRVHEVIIPSGDILHVDIPILHQKTKVQDSTRNLRIYEDMEKKGELHDARHIFYYGRELFQHQRYEDAIQVFERFLKIPEGWTENKLDACRLLSDAWLALQNSSAAYAALFSSFLLAAPRAETCCRLASLFLKDDLLLQAIYWYETALHLPKPIESGGFIEEDCYGFLPAIQLCVCYYRLGEMQKALSYHSLASSLRPNHPSVLQNEQFFQTILHQKG